MKKIIVQDKYSMQKLANKLVKKVLNSKNNQQTKTMALSGNLGSGKTTFTQFFLEALKIKGPFTSPTFVIMKEYQYKKNNNNFNIYHIDAYRISSKDLLALGWKELIRNKNNIIIIEWADKVKDIIPPSATWLNFEIIDENKRKIIINWPKN